MLTRKEVEAIKEKAIYYDDHPNVLALCAALAEAMEAMRALLGVLPDSRGHDYDDAWEWCWNELDGKSQDEVKAARAVSDALLAAYDAEDEGRRIHERVKEEGA